MEWKWRSQQWRDTHPRSLKERVGAGVQAVIKAMRGLIGKIAGTRPLTYLELAAAFKHAQKIEGDYCEFGVYTGRSFVHAYKVLTRQERTQTARFFAFDSFEGLPEPGEADSVYTAFAKGGLAATKAEFEANLARHHVDAARVEIIAGWFDRTLTPELAARIGPERIATVMIDCDLYVSTVPVLNFLTDLLADGAVLIFDDWHLYRAHPELGVQKAFFEWKAQHPHLHFADLGPLPGSFQKAFIVSRLLGEEGS